MATAKILQIEMRVKRFSKFSPNNVCAQAEFPQDFCLGGIWRGRGPFVLEG